MGELAAELTSVCARHELPLWQAGAAALDGWATARLGDLPGGLARLRSGQDDWRRLVPALDAVARTGRAQQEPELLRLRGELLLAGPGDADAAERSMRRAERLAGQRQARGFRLRAATSLARLWHARGRTRQARALLGGQYGWFTEGHDTADLTRARALLGTLAADADREA